MFMITPFPPSSWSWLLFLKSLIIISSRNLYNKAIAASAPWYLHHDEHDPIRKRRSGSNSWPISLHDEITLFDLTNVIKLPIMIMNVYLRNLFHIIVDFEELFSSTVILFVLKQVTYFIIAIDFRGFYYLEHYIAGHQFQSVYPYSQMMGGELTYAFNKSAHTTERSPLVTQVNTGSVAIYFDKITRRRLHLLSYVIRNLLHIINWIV